MVTSTGAALGAEAADRLARVGSGACRIEPGLTDAEFARIEAELGFQFADDHRAFLAAGLPLSVLHEDPPGVISTYRSPWPDWRDGDLAALRERLDWPVEGVLYDVEHNAYWHDSWGDRPEAPAHALAVARQNLANAPKLVPIHAHRYLPAGRDTHGHAVLSIYQTDIIVYGADLADYIYQEFGGAPAAQSDAHQTARLTVDFWSDFP